MIKKTTILFMLAICQLYTYAQQNYQLDVKKSKILWDARKTMGGHYGYLLFNSGNLNYSAQDEPLTGSFSMNMKTISSTDHTSAAANQKVDKELKTEAFFNVGKYPVAVMNVKQIIHSGTSTLFKVTGDLTIKGIKNPISFVADIKKNGNTIIATAELKIDRIKWNINHKPDKWDFMASIKDKVIADEIPISLKLVFHK